MRSVIDRPFTVIAHRGAGDSPGDNTAESFQAALAAGVPALECDVRQTADGALVLLHDGVVPLPGGGRLVVRQASLAALRVAIPSLLTLEEFLEEFGEQALVNLDLKGSGFERRLVTIVERWGHPERVYITSHHAASLRRLALSLRPHCVAFRTATRSRAFPGGSPDEAPSRCARSWPSSWRSPCGWRGLMSWRSSTGSSRHG
jgi:glycerophosphoryl diester phosphodiesterase